MSDTPDTTQPCPDCGHPNAIDAANCENCNFPLHTEASVDAEQPTKRSPAESAAAPAAPIPVPPRLKRLRKKKRTSSISTSIWLFTGTLAALSLVLFAVKSNVDRIEPDVPGANPVQQDRANELRALVAQDSTNVDAQIALADVLYDTGNWPEAIVHYRSAIRQDSSRYEAIVDLGVCYYNLGVTDEAERHFQLALRDVPNQTVALFNMGILNERRHDHEEALAYYHRALQSNPAENVRPVVIEAIERAQAATGKLAPPLSEGK